MITKEDFPLLYDRVETPFVQDLINPEGKPSINLNGTPMSVGIWNMIVSKRDLAMWTRFKMKPHRRWKVSDVKTYFGLKGHGKALMTQFLSLVEEVEKAQKMMAEA